MFVFSRNFATEFLLSAIPINSLYRALLKQKCQNVQNWVLTIHDIARSPPTLLALYAYDTTVISRNSDMVQLHSHIHLLKTFFAKCRIKVDSNKSTVVFFSKKKFHYPLST